MFALVDGALTLSELCLPLQRKTGFDIMAQILIETQSPRSKTELFRRISISKPRMNVYLDKLIKLNFLKKQLVHNRSGSNWVYYECASKGQEFLNYYFTFCKLFNNITDDQDVKNKYSR